MRDLEQHYQRHLGSSSRLYPRVREVLLQLHADGVALAVVTNKPGQFTARLLAHHGLGALFAQVISGDTLARKKPDPIQLLHVCNEFGIAPARMLMIGDSGNDALAARAAGCPVFCVSYGYNEGHDVHSLDVDAIVAALTDCIPLIRKP